VSLIARHLDTPFSIHHLTLGNPVAKSHQEDGGQSASAALSVAVETAFALCSCLAWRKYSIHSNSVAV
jgi:hypothetical protein